MLLFHERLLNRVLGGDDPTSVPSAMKNYLHNIRARMTNPLRIRVGGNSMDSSTYVPEQQHLLNVIDDAYYNNIPVQFGPMLFKVMNAMADAVGEMDFIISLSMLDPQNDTNVVELAAAATSALGTRLDAIILGNVRYTLGPQN